MNFLDLEKQPMTHSHEQLYNSHYTAICGAVLMLWVPLFIWGKQIREKSISWRVMRWAQWDTDREVGE
ncbi:hypothetical protein N7481_009206 [Penicillium waksmanii]|uniref:uncharacterized protein n=1 Tax=Penicillium waksmanii TaxID=69791 RepID=UPI0025489748|nr:uncharacterized protein N7481_009206 [Penicillium waksmanii]KAJ5975499.1 hypothetical protein N7481_009206 [Penicillium waksmanii]